jgi:hypothetical protein
MTELAELQHWRCPWCGDYLPELADAHGVGISTDIGQYRAEVRRRAAIYAVRQLASLAARPVTGLWPPRGVARAT